jgi:TatA/E family protein of Tat protein translocase
MFEGLFQPMHLLLIGGIALLVFGPKQLPELGKGLGDRLWLPNAPVNCLLSFKRGILVLGDSREIVRSGTSLGLMRCSGGV